MKPKIAVIGAVSYYGNQLLSALSEFFPKENIHVLNTNKKLDKTTISYGEKEVLNINILDQFDFKNINIVINLDLLLNHSQILHKLNPECILIDTTEKFRFNPQIPLIVSYVNFSSLKFSKLPKIISVASPLSALISLALKPLHDNFTVKRFTVSTYQSVSSSGKEGMDELFNQTRSLYINQPMVYEHFSKQIAFNVIPYIGTFLEGGETSEEWNLICEIKKIIDPKIKGTVTCVMVPVFVGYAASLTIEFKKEIEINTVRKILKQSPLVSLMDYRTDEGYVTPAEINGEDRIFISRIRSDITVENGLSLWLAGDNLKCGFAFNIVHLIHYLVKYFNQLEKK
ncbi:MAG: aspartate-semialdehyde dehydrogenase [Alphaproteobacteria bacterium]|nr:aspartate-semialdehyde dehydrogenase [Alphaproteobacteria bacterium]